jgi:GntR family transcriptional regulator/MocR family aminotransferase
MADTRTNSGPATDLLVELRRDARVPLHGQLATAIREGIRSGRLRPGNSLPPSRTLAAGLGVSRGVVVEAYEQLTAEGYLAARPGGYTRVAPGLRSAPATPPPAPGPAVRVDFSPCRADVSHFPRAAWLRSVRRALHEAPHERLGYLGGQGAPELRRALADYLDRARGTVAEPDRVVVCSGFTQGLGLVSRVLASAGVRRIAIEDPSDPDLRRVPAAAGLEVVGIPVDRDGIAVDALLRSRADAVVVTAAHQCPTGAVLSAEARTALVEWATRRGGWIVEDDYDAEYRYDRAPIGALQGLAPDHVIYAGSASKTLAPGLRLGWLVAPARLVDDLAAAKQAADRGSPVLDQLAFADFLSRGELDRHLRRMRPLYRRRRNTLLDALATHLPSLRPAGVSAGLYLTAWLPPDLDEAEVVDAAARHGVRLYGVAPYRVRPDSPGAPGASAGPGLIFGYGDLPEPAITEGITTLATVIAGLRA